MDIDLILILVFREASSQESVPQVQTLEKYVCNFLFPYTERMMLIRFSGCSIACPNYKCQHYLSKRLEFPRRFAIDISIELWLWAWYLNFTARVNNIDIHGNIFTHTLCLRLMRWEPLVSDSVQRFAKVSCYGFQFVKGAPGW